MKRMVLAFPIVLALAAGGCVDDPELGEASGNVIGGDGSSCPKLGCSSNSAFLGPTEFHELEWTGQSANKEGFRLTGLAKTVNGVTKVYRPAIINDTELVGQTLTLVRLWPTNASVWMWVTTLQGLDLVNADLWVDGPGPNNPDYKIKITSVSTNQDLWQAPVATVNTYELKWFDPNSTSATVVPRNICKNPPDRRDGEGRENENVLEAVLYTGDRYDTDQKTVTATTPAEAGTWMNFGCAGGVLWKLALNRHTYATRGTTVTTWAQRQTMLKMYTSDVCNTGDAFTVTGTPIKWVSTTLLSSGPLTAPLTMEARWNENGAICYDTHRLNRTPNDMDGDVFYQRIDQIHPKCAAAGNTAMFHPCGASDTNYYLITASPALAGP